MVTVKHVSSDDFRVTSEFQDPSKFDDLIAGARAGDPRAVEQLFRELQPRLLRFLRSLAGRPRPPS